MTYFDKSGECCPKFDVKMFDAKTHVWKDKPFIRDYVVQLFHIPLNMGPVIMRMFGKIKRADAAPKNEDFLLLAYDPSPWKSELYMTVTKKVPDAENVTLSGTFFSKVFDGPYDAVPKWIAEMEKLLASKGKKAKKYYVHYAYCPKCAKKYGHNYSAVFAEI